jgi:hypothetical protein
LRTAANAPAQIGQNISQTIYDTLNPNPAGTLTYYVTVFPDGSKHAVDPATIASDNTFTWSDGQNYTMFTGVGGHAAVLTSSIVSSNAAVDYANAVGDALAMGRY